MQPFTIDQDFTVSEAARAANVDVETLRSWLKRGKFNIATETRKWTRLSFVELCQIAVFADVLAGNASQTLAQYVADGSAETFERLYLLDKRGASLPTIAILCGREVDGGGNQIGGVVYDDTDKLAARLHELVSSGVSLFQVINLTSVFNTVRDKVSE